MNLEYFSRLISRIFDFYVWFPMMLVLTTFNSGLSSNQIKILLPVLLIVDVVIPVSYFFMHLAGRRVSDIDVTKREERYHLFGRLVMISAISLIIVYILSNRTFLVLQLISFCLALTIFIITFFYKISGHVILNTSAVFILNFLFDWKLMWLFLIVPVVAFARLYLKKHTVAEVLAGGIVGFVEPYLILKLFKLL